MNEQRQLQSMQDALSEAQKTIAEQQAFIERVVEPPLKHGAVVLIDEDNKRVVMSDGSGLVSVIPPEWVKQLYPGAVVQFHAQSGAILFMHPVPTTGVIAEITKFFDDVIELALEGKPQLVYRGAAGDDAKIGDRVVLDQGKLVIVNNLGPATANTVDHNTYVTWNDIVGLEDAKQQLQEATVLPYTHKEVFKRYNKKAPKGVLLYGPPGCGKTMLAKAVATAVQQQEVKGGFIYVKGPEILDMYVGVAEGRVRSLFNQARAFKQEHDMPAVLFIDEADAILAKRGSHVSSDVDKTIVPAFLAEMDGLDDSSAMVLLATNRADTLDPAVVRDGRIDRRIKISRPMPDDIETLFTRGFTDVPTSLPVPKLVEHAMKEFFAEEYWLYQLESEKKVHVFHFCDIVSGAMIVNIIEIATSFAITRDLKSRTKGGLQLEDLTHAINRAFSQNRDMNHDDDLALAKETLPKIISITKNHETKAR